MGIAPPTLPGPLGATPPGPAGPVDLDPQGTVLSGHACVVCGYSLRGLNREALCPECATPVAHSLRGNLLAYCSTEYLDRLHRGVVLILAAIIVDVLVIVAPVLVLLTRVLGAIPPIPFFAPLQGLIGVATSAMTLYGWWLFSELDPGYVSVDSGAIARRLIRGTVVVLACTSATSAVLWVLQSSPVGGVVPVWQLIMLGRGAWAVGTIVLFFASLRYLRWLAPRIPSTHIARRAKVLMWMGPLLLGLGVVSVGVTPFGPLGPIGVTVGLIITVVLYWNLLNRVRHDLKRIRCGHAAVA